MARRPAAPRDVMRAAFYSLWGVLTLVLIFTVTYLFARLSQSDGEGVTARPAGGAGTGTAEKAPVEQSPVRLYFADPLQLRLMVEERPLALGSETRENCRAALLELIKGPTGQASPVLPPVARVRALYLLDSGELVIDFSREIDAAPLHSASAEWLAAQALAHTLAQPALHASADWPVTSVRLLYEGSPAEEGFPGHIALPGPLRPDPRLLGE